MKHRLAIELLQETAGLKLVQARELDGFGKTEAERHDNSLRAAGLREEVVELSEAIQTLTRIGQGWF